MKITTKYEDAARTEMKYWSLRMQKLPSVTERITQNVQRSIHQVLPERVHQIIAETMDEVAQKVLLGNSFIISNPQHFEDFKACEHKVLEQTMAYTSTGSMDAHDSKLNNIYTNAVDFPELLKIKVQLLFDVAALYGFDLNDYRERLFVLYIFQMAFSTKGMRSNAFDMLISFEKKKSQLPEQLENFDLSDFQKIFKENIDPTKMAQMTPYLGPAIGLVTNWRLVKKLSNTAIQAYRLRYFKNRIKP